MAILWAGAEDIDFPQIGGFTVNTTAGSGLFRTGWARCSLHAGGLQFAKSDAFPGGPVVSAWFSGRAYLNTSGTNSSMFGVGSSGTSNILGIGSDATSNSKAVLIKSDGTTRTVLATESGNSIPSSANFRVDMQIVNYGATATVNLYINSVSVISFTGDVRVGGSTNFDSVFIQGLGGNNADYSELFVSDADTRAIQGLQTLALTGPGTTTAWTNNTFSNINGSTFSDNSPASVNSAAADQQYTVTAPTPATYTVAGVMITARMAKTATAVPTQVKLGYGNGAAGAFGTGAAKTVTTGYQTYRQLDSINPITGVAFTPSDLSALKLDLESA